MTEPKFYLNMNKSGLMIFDNLHFQVRIRLNYGNQFFKSEQNFRFTVKVEIRTLKNRKRDCKQFKRMK